MNKMESYILRSILFSIIKDFDSLEQAWFQFSAKFFIYKNKY